jgi:predicted DNA-binding transcriptional regulator AlpA
MNDEGFYLFRDIELRTKKSRSTLWRWIRDKRFPAQIQMGPNSIGWRKSDYHEWEKDPLAWAKKHQCQAQ